MKVTRFQRLSNEEKIEFFVKCQELLTTHHPTSEFLFTKDNLESRKNFVLDFVNKYKGFVYYDENICILYNKVFVKDPNDPVKVIKDHIYQEPREMDYNAVSIDFVVFRQLTDCIGFCRAQYNPQIAYILFVRHNEIKLYESQKLLKSLSGSSGHLGI